MAVRARLINSARFFYAHYYYRQKMGAATDTKLTAVWDKARSPEFVTGSLACIYAGVQIYLRTRKGDDVGRTLGLALGLPSAFVLSSLGFNWYVTRNREPHVNNTRFRNSGVLTASYFALTISGLVWTFQDMHDDDTDGALVNGLLAFFLPLVAFSASLPSEQTTG